jgi:hypothetical protein
VGAHPCYSRQWEKHYSISRLAEVIINFFLETEVRDSQRKLLVRVANNSFVFHDKLDYEEYGNAEVKSIRKKSNGEVLIEINILDSRNIEIKGRFEHPAGYVLINDAAIIIMPDNITISGNHIQTYGAAIEIKRDGLTTG